MGIVMPPTLWHITISHYSEKARWALDHKSIPYRLRAPLPGAHIPVALWLTRGRHYTLPALDRLEAELGASDYLVGESFSVADLTAAALLYPLVRPPEAYVTIDRMPEPVERLRAQLRERRGYRWVEETFRRHRRSAEAPSGA